MRFFNTRRIETGRKGASQKKSKVPLNSPTRDKINEIRLNWVSGDHPISFGGISQIKKHYPREKLSTIRKAMAGLDTYTLYRRVKKPSHYNPIYVYNKRELMQCDLICFSNPTRKPQEELTEEELEKEETYKAYNDGKIYLLVVIDSFTRYAWIKPMAQKDRHTVLKALQTLVSEEMDGYFGEVMLSDEGGEFVNHLMQAWMKKEGIKRRQPNFHAPTVERFNQTFQNMLFRYMNYMDTKRYIDVVAPFLKNYNEEKYHRIIKMTPAQAEKEENYDRVLKNVKTYYEKAVGGASERKKRPKFKKGDLVRISKLKTKFAKGYHKNFQSSVYKINEVMTTMPIPMYRLVHDDGKNTPEVGSWYEAELQLVLPEETEGLIYKTNTLKTRKRRGQEEELVRYVYWPERYSQWQPANQENYEQARNEYQRRFRV